MNWHPRIQHPEGRAPHFNGFMLGMLGLFVAFLAALALADFWYVPWEAMRQALASPALRAACWLSLWTTATTALLGLLVGVPVGYALSRYHFPGRALADALIDLPIVLPPVIAGLTLLIFFQTAPGRWIESTGLRFVYDPKGIVLCQFLVSASLGVRALQLTFDGIDPRLEGQALTLGCTRWSAFWRVTMPLARGGILTAGILVWARAFGVFGPLIIFVGGVRGKTEVLPTAIYLEQSVGRDEVGMAIALGMMAFALLLMTVLRLLHPGFLRAC